ncbi:MAG TPA: hypothetical protein VK796_03400 [Cytophaga sp.]|jgi:hypothetical protein|nr:hypothetical protein [Cytophaga sp.]
MIIYKIAKAVKNVEAAVLNVYRFVLSLGKITILSKYNLKLPKATHSDCIVLGNGPSLRDTINLHRDVLEKADLFAVNNFPNSKEFMEFKPANYIVLDPGYFLNKHRSDIIEVFRILKDDVTWTMNFFVPYMYRKDKDVVELKNKKGFVKICFYNYTILKGPANWIYPLFKKNLGMPQFYNVMGAGIYVALNCGYKNVWLVGADHSWFDNLHVGEDNIVYRKDIHFYDNAPEQIKLSPMIEPVSNTKVPMEGLFWALSTVFKSYGILFQYATYLNATIINASEFSYLDTFVRKNLKAYKK